MNTPISLQLAKLLKEKSIKISYNKKHYLNKDGEEVTDEFIAQKYNNHIPASMDAAKSVWAVSHIPAPIISEVVMCLYEKHGIWISAIPNIKNELWKPILLQNGKDDIYDEFAFNSPTAAYSAAIEYTLKNLIK